MNQSVIAVSPATTTRPPAAIKRLRARVEEIENLFGDSCQSWIAPENDAIRIERDVLCKEIESLEALGDGRPLLTVTLDAYGSALVRRALAEGDGELAADIVNGALSFTLGAYDDHDWPAEAVKAAARREGKEAA